MQLRKNVDHGGVICWNEVRVYHCETTESDTQLKHSATQATKLHMNGQNLHSIQTSSEAQTAFYSQVLKYDIIPVKHN
jgi:hypothetical protein